MHSPLLLLVLIQLVQQPAQRLAIFSRQPTRFHEAGQQRVNLACTQLVGRGLQPPHDQFVALDARRKLMRPRFAVPLHTFLGFEPLQ